ncbi:hypothetical protein PGT21_027225 [Puccinia graminis f. sp. tritici]|uniref:Uncharacterized protein n=1 Tax=Puccinia graminis f. sp. tritici TaxID=56615 RepID=A0A5B0NE33_PUCGR|nr:hypothetical protein PGTUg99_002218 [Puccinia graminis f. sp. tritici]KAA1086019.1 hypothetical protein PGT21_027225 [Puccinia graminis f. sp. tritici]
MTEDNINFIKGELKRPEIRILCVIMNSLLKSTRDLLPVVEKPETADKDIAPTLVYSGKQKATFQTELSPVLLDFAGSLVEKFEDFFWEKYPEAASFLPEHLFGLDEATNIVRHIPDIDSPKDLLNDTRGNPVDGQLKLLYESVVEFRQGVVFHNHLNACQP